MTFAVLRHLLPRTFRVVKESGQFCLGLANLTLPPSVRPPKCSDCFGFLPEPTWHPPRIVPPPGDPPAFLLFSTSFVLLNTTTLLLLLLLLLSSSSYEDLGKGNRSLIAPRVNYFANLPPFAWEFDQTGGEANELDGATFRPTTVGVFTCVSSLLFTFRHSQVARFPVKEASR